ncbi:Endogenous retrovirus group 3 member 1 Env polyprotein [Plecturocebus cupreus]
MLESNGKGLDPRVSIQMQGKIQKRSARPVYQHFYGILNKLVLELPKKTKNLFLQFAKNMAHSLNVTSCCVCGGTTMGDRWPWEARELLPSNPVPELNSVQRVSIIGQYCLAKEGTAFTVPVGKLSCLEKNPLLKFPKLQDAWNHPGYRRDWTAPLGCTGYVDIKHTYSCLKDGQTGELLGHPVYSTREKRSLKIGKWENNKWPLERIIEYYRPATGAENGSWGNQTPIYTLNQIIQLRLPW